MSEDKKWKIICSDNYDRDSVSDTLVCENINNEHIGKLLEDFLNNRTHKLADAFYRLVPQEHKLYVWEP